MSIVSGGERYDCVLAVIVDEDVISVGDNSGGSCWSTTVEEEEADQRHLTGEGMGDIWRWGDKSVQRSCKLFANAGWTVGFDDDDVEVLNEFKPQITARFPFQDHEDNPLVENISLFCHPSGSINLKQQDPMPKVSTHATLPFLHYFKTRKSTSSNQYLSFSD